MSVGTLGWITLSIGWIIMIIGWNLKSERGSSLCYGISQYLFGFSGGCFVSGIINN